MLFSQAKGHKVVSSATAATVGKVSQFVVDPVARSVVALRLKKTQDGDWLHWSDLTAFGTDAVTVADDSVIGGADAEVQRLSHKDFGLLGKRVLTSAGDELGHVDDVEFDPQTGSLTTLHLSHGSREATAAGARLLGVGSYAVVVREEH